MSTYAIADAIDKFAKNFKEVVSEKNQIEKEKLAFEKEKYDFKKALKEEIMKPKNCCHNWVTEVRKSDYIDEQGNEYCAVYQHCRECGTTDIRMHQLKTEIL